uniref:Uncharacterized protein n=1 Tax=Lepeophtheirus salmonis TaxID=72036 RepID=A0A0K2U8C5_LEPSM
MPGQEHSLGMCDMPITILQFYRPNCPSNHTSRHRLHYYPASMHQMQLFHNLSSQGKRDDKGDTPK